MYNMLNWKFITGTAVVILAFCIGIFLYARWDVHGNKIDLDLEGATVIK